MSQAASAAMSSSPGALSRLLALAAVAAVVLAVALFAGPRYGLLLLIGLGFGLALEGFRFGFTGPWRRMILERDASGLLAQLICIALVASVAFPLLAANGAELKGAHAPIGVAMIGGAFVFGAAMQIVLGCGSGTLVNAGSGNAIGAVALPFFAIGSFAGAYHLTWWTNLGSLPVVALSGGQGLAITLVGLGAVAALALMVGKPGSYRLPARYWGAILALAGLAILHLVVAGQPWGVVYGLGLWVAKVVVAVGGDLSGSAFWSAPGNQGQVAASVLTDVTSLTDFGLIGGAALMAWWRAGLASPVGVLPARAWAAVIIAGLVLGYSSRLAFGCNIGAFFSGIGTGSAHGWVWFIAAFAGSWVGVRLRPSLGLEARK
ncbi:putative inner membrane protein [Roseovarius sp. EC-HK134]|uniref:Putative inner membrane protein n=2 Tax=Roseobacteraceae TaxID=2854170 RepID=A0A1V0RIT0_9RHOB|nr:putative inner membrane protein [Roseovarius mucosus]VVT31151.1 putative inner membrane protein [Roseovarius sp. EC-HK134]VVT31734.1 putative inner membrane protein [Roseovarius sp. EC-SD190]